MPAVKSVFEIKYCLNEYSIKNRGCTDLLDLGRELIDALLHAPTLALPRHQLQTQIRRLAVQLVTLRLKALGF